MAQIKNLNSDRFWEWMAPPVRGFESGVHGYVETILQYTADTGYIVEPFSEYPFNSSSAIMDSLSRCMPRDYFLDVQFCASTYATIFGKLFPPLASHLDEMAYVEWLLYMEPGYLPYRDHLVHMFKVAFVGDQLLSIDGLLSEIAERQFDMSQHLSQWAKKRGINISKWLGEKKDIVKIAFFIAAIFHDFGYGYFFLRTYRRRLHSLYRWLMPEADQAELNTPNTKLLTESLPGYFVLKYHGWERPKSMSDASLDSLIAGFFRDCLPLNHSVASAFCVLDMAETLWRMGALTQEMYVAFQLAAEACMIHDMVSESNWLHLRKNQNQEHFLCCDNHSDIPLAMLLVLTDELSIWDRYPLSQEVQGDRVVFRLDKNTAPKDIEITVETDPQKTMTIIASPPESQNVLKSDFERLKPFKKRQGASDSFLLDHRLILS